MFFLIAWVSSHKSDCSHWINSKKKNTLLFQLKAKIPSNVSIRISSNESGIFFSLHLKAQQKKNQNFNFCLTYTVELCRLTKKKIHEKKFLAIEKLKKKKFRIWNVYLTNANFYIIDSHKKIFLFDHQDMSIKPLKFQNPSSFFSSLWSYKKKKDER